ncbi:hypothetical protein CR513_11651, partial [Mucuna pruriens]
MYQGFKSVEEYYKDCEVALLKANVLESNEVIITCFLHGMSREIQDIVKLYHYTSLDDLRRCLASKKTYPNSSSSWKGKEREKERLPSRGQKEEHTPPIFGSPSKSIHIKFFKCLGKGHIASHALTRGTWF